MAAIAVMDLPPKEKGPYCGPGNDLHGVGGDDRVRRRNVHHCEAARL